MEVITIDSKAFQQLVEKVNLIADYVHEARLEQSTNSDEEWVDSQVVCQYLRICEKTLQRLRAAGKIESADIPREGKCRNPVQARLTISVRRAIFILLTQIVKN